MSFLNEIYSFQNYVKLCMNGKIKLSIEFIWWSVINYRPNFSVICITFLCILRILLYLLESIWKFSECVGWTQDTLDCCRKILQPPNGVRFIYLYNSWYLICLNNKNHKVQITDFEFISNVFMCRMDRKINDENKFCLSIDIQHIQGNWYYLFKHWPQLLKVALWQCSVRNKGRS